MRILAVAFAATVICRHALTYAHETTALKVMDIERKNKVQQQQQKEKQLLLLQESRSYRDLQQQMMVMVKEIYQVQQQLLQLVSDISSVAMTTNSLAVIVLTFFLLLMFFGGIINYKEKVIASSTNSAVEGSVELVDGAISASDADLTSDVGAVQKEVDDDDDAMTGHGDSKISR